MDTKEGPVRIAVREAPFRSNRRSVYSVLQFPEQCANTVLVDNSLFHFDCAFRATVSQQELYESLVQPLVDKLFEGYDCTALAYGQTGTGKSYSMGMAGYAEFMQEQHLGVAPRCLKDILQRIEQAGQENMPGAEVSASFVEIYNEKVYDLLVPAMGAPLITRGQRFEGSKRMILNCDQDLQQLLLLGTRNRHVRPTNMNTNSSRSHAILTIRLRQDMGRYARLNIVDLAGSEGVRRTGHQGMARMEGVHINQGLLSINKVLMAMSSGQTLIPYRESVLTTVLQESLNARAYLTLLACISPHVSDLSETTSTLRFAKNAKRLKLTPQQSRLVQLQNQKRSLINVASVGATPQGFRRIQPSSTTIKRGLSVKPGGGVVNNSYSTPREKAAVVPLLQRTRSEMGLTPKAKERAREELQMSLETINCSSHNSDSLLQVDDQLPHPTLLDYTLLKNKYEALLKQQQDQQQLREQQLVDVAKPLLNYSDFNSTLCSIAEEEPVLGDPLSSSSPSTTASHSLIPKISGVDTLGSSAAEISLVPSTETAHTAITRRRSLRLMNQRTLNMSNELPVPTRRSRRISLRAEHLHLSQNQMLALPELVTSNLNQYGASKSARLRQHRVDLLDWFNKASVKELKKLPSIGPKTAFTLVMQRNLVGSFKNWQQIKNLPVWSRNSFTRFAISNCLEM